MIGVTNQPTRRTIVVRLTGLIGPAEMQEFAEKYRAATDTYGGQPHLVLADMRGMKTNTPAAAGILQSAIAYARARGVHCCAHISDDTVARLQMARIAREVAAGDDVTVDVVSLEEAEAVLHEKRFELLKNVPTPATTA
jgi:hypothetical protein